MMRAMVLEYPEDLNVRSLSTQYMLGESLLPAFVVTVVEASDIKAPEGHAAESHAESSP